MKVLCLLCWRNRQKRARQEKFVTVNKCVFTFSSKVLSYFSCKQDAQVTELVSKISYLHNIYLCVLSVISVITFHSGQHVELEVFGECSASACSVKRQVSCGLRHGATVYRGQKGQKVQQWNVCIHGWRQKCPVSIITG